jgi:hypothetical protein
MGATVSSEGVDKETFRLLAPEHYSEELFDELKGSDERISHINLMLLTERATDVFLAHDLGMDELGRSNHERVRLIDQLLKASGLRTWFDEDALKANAREQIHRGVLCSSCIVVFITERYLTKVSGEGVNDERGSFCLKFDFIARVKGRSRIIPVVMEPSCLNIDAWFGLMGEMVGESPYINFSSDEPGRAEEVVQEIVKMVRREVSITVNERIASIKSISQNGQDLKQSLSPPHGTK